MVVTSAHQETRPVRVPRALEVLAAWSWRLILVGLATYGVALLAVRLSLVLMPVAIAILLTTALMPIRKALTNRGVPMPLAMLAVVVTFFGVIAVAGLIIVPPLVDEFRDLPRTLRAAADDVQEWLVDGVGVDERLARDGRRELESALDGARVPQSAVLDGATLAGQLFAGFLLAIVVTFFAVKDGELIQRKVLSWFPERRVPGVRAAGNAAWSALGGYLRGSATLGAFEGVVIGVTLLLVGAGLALPVAVLTFFAAFFPFVGAIAAGVVAVSVALVTSGPGAAAIVAVVAVAVQQLDGDVLAPMIYGKALELHPLVVILAITSGGALAGLAGAFLAVPVVAVGLRAMSAVQKVDDAEARGATAGEVEQIVEDPSGSR